MSEVLAFVNINGHLLFGIIHRKRGVMKLGSGVIVNDNAFYCHDH
jgi:hypothetical protein